MERRSILILGSGGLAAALLGGGLAWRHAGRSSSAPPPAASAATQRFWQSHFERPEGGPLDLAALQGKPLLLNFWATWCTPCVQEMPELDRFQREQRGRWQVLGLALDQPGPVRDFLKKLPVSFQIGMAGASGTELLRGLGNPAGGLPFSVAFNAAGHPFWRKLGPTHLAELKELARSQM